MGFIVVGIPEMVDITSSWVSRFASFYCQICIELFSGCLDLEVREPNGSQKLIFSGISQNWIDIKRYSFDCCVVALPLQKLLLGEGISDNE